ncbi:unnamed protein product [Fusarium graminearum]|nr:unnamed protein product [Fusarium graminearum]
MKINNLIFLALGSLRVAADSDFAATCHDILVSQPGGNANYPKDRFSLYAWCRKEKGAWSESFLNLSKCIANDGGNLVARENGGMGGSCRDMRLSGTVLLSRCVNNNGGTTDASIDLNRLVGNRDGALTCFGASHAS